MSDYIASRDHDPSTGAATRVPARAATWHTPGPWAVQDGDVWDIRWPEREGTERLGCPLAIIRRNSPIWDDRGDLPFEANARLISAAPDLLEALKRIAEANERNTNSATIADFRSWVGAVANTAIAKAEGRE